MRRNRVMGYALLGALAVPGAAMAAQDADTQADAVDNASCTQKEQVQFKVGETSLDQDAKQSVAQVAEWLREDDRRFVRIEGHADPSGSPAMNQRLSEKRAQSVEQQLFRAGIDRGRVLTFGRGEEMAPSVGSSPEEMRVVVINQCERAPATASADGAAATGAAVSAQAAEPAMENGAAENGNGAYQQQPSADQTQMNGATTEQGTGPGASPETGAATTGDGTAAGATTSGDASEAPTQAETLPGDTTGTPTDMGTTPGTMADPTTGAVVTDPTLMAQPEAQEPGLASRIGVGVSVGGGVVGFVDEDTRDVTDPGGSWEARVTVGTRLPVALELAYIGSAQNLEVAGFDEDAILLGNGAEATLRLQIPISIVTPYVFGGIGWTRYDITRNDDALTAALIPDSDNVGTVPFGLGLALGNLGGFILDLRGTGRATFNDDLLNAAVATTGNSAQLHSWNVTLRLGAEF
jgi:outer membrane protein OmpA-like peptidoglycan-associated protein